METRKLLMLAFCLMFLGCGRIYGPVKEVKAFIEEKEQVIFEMHKKINQSPNQAGIDEARKILNERKAILKAKQKAFLGKPRSINSDWMTMWFESEVNDTKYFQMISTETIALCSPCPPEVLSGISALEREFKEALK